MLYVQCPYSLEIPAITKQINKKTLCNGYKFYLAPNLGVFRVIKYVRIWKRVENDEFFVEISSLLFSEGGN